MHHLNNLSLQIYKKRKDMRRYWFELVDEHLDDLDAAIPDGSNKQAAINKARRWMRDNGISKATLVINSMRTGNLLGVAEIEID